MFWWEAQASAWIFDGIGTAILGAPPGGLGALGGDTANNYAWINVDHASEWGLAQVANLIPEPSSLALLAAALGCMVRRR